MEQFQCFTSQKIITAVLATPLTFPQGQAHPDISKSTTQLQSCVVIKWCGNMLQHLVLIKVDCTFLSLSPVNLCSYVLSTDAAVLNVITATLSYRRVSYGYCYPHNLSSPQAAAIISCTTEMPSPAQKHSERQSLGRHLQAKQTQQHTNKRENHCQVQDPQSGMRSIGKSIPPSPRSLSCSIHTLPFRLGGQFTHWDQPQLLAAASVMGRSESQCMSTGSIFLQDKIGIDFSNSCQLKHFWLQIRKKILFSFVLPYRPNWLKSI